MVITDKIVEKFWDNVKKDGPDSCWIWVGKRFSISSYGYLMVDSKMVRAHRLSYEIHR